MAAVTEFGVIVAPPAPAFYLRPEPRAAIAGQITLPTIGFLRSRNAPPPRPWSVPEH